MKRGYQFSVKIRLLYIILFIKKKKIGVMQNCGMKDTKVIQI